MYQTLEEAITASEKYPRKGNLYLLEGDEDSWEIHTENSLEIGKPTAYTIKPNGEVIRERIYPTPCGLCHSVTHILNATASEEKKERLRKWQHKMDKIHGTGQGKATRDESARRGTNCHTAIAHFMRGTLKEHPQSVYFESVLPLLKLIRSQEIIGLEQFVWSKKGYAGRYDLITDWEGVPTIFDWKTSHRPKRKQWLDDHFIQTTAYSLAREERTLLPCEQMAIVVIHPKGFQVFTEPLSQWRDAWEERLNHFLATI
jgi:genome maintenance exonuclease 1